MRIRRSESLCGRNAKIAGREFAASQLRHRLHRAFLGPALTPGVSSLM